MTTIGSASSNPPVSNPNGHFSTKAADRAQRKDAIGLFTNMGRFHFEPNDVDTKKALLNDVYTALESGVAIPKNPQELLLAEHELVLDQLEAILNTERDFPDIANSLIAGINQGKDLLKKHQGVNGHYDMDAFSTDFKKINDLTDQGSQDTINQLKTAVRGVFTENPQLLFEKAAAYPESVQRLVELLELPTQNDKGWNLTSQTAKAGNPKLAKAFEKAGFGSNLYPKVVVDFAQAMSDDAPNADKSKALKELMGVTPLS